MKDSKKVGDSKRTGRLSMDNNNNNNDDEQRRRDRVDAQKYRMRKEARDQLVFYAAIVGGTITVLYTLMQIIGDKIQ